MKIRFFSSKDRPKIHREKLYLNKVILAIIMVFAIFISSFNVSKASEPLYYYDKYRVDREYEKYLYERHKRSQGRLPIPRGAVCYVRYSFTNSGGVDFNPQTGKFTGWGETVVYDYFYDNYSDLYYVEPSGNVYYHIYFTDPNEPLLRERYADEYRSRITNGKRGSYMQTVTGTINQYPANGVHTDGYWYVRKGLVNNNPTITITTPYQNSYFV